MEPKKECQKSFPTTKIPKIFLETMKTQNLNPMKTKKTIKDRALTIKINRMKILTILKVCIPMKKKISIK